MKKNLLKVGVLFLMMLIVSQSNSINFVQAFSSSSDVIYEGIDVSSFQGIIDYSKVKEAGIEVVYIKTSEGEKLEDPYFKSNYENAKANGLKVGLYHFVRAKDEEEAQREAKFFASVIADTEPDCKLAMDFEILNDLSKEEVNNISFAFLQKLQELTNKECVIYSDAYNANNIFSAELADKYPLWIAEYGVEEPGNIETWNSWIGFQYTSEGRVDGINGNVDRDKYTKDIFLNREGNFEIEPNPKPEEPNLNEVDYVVRKGDTLSQIAIKYHTTVSELVKENKIKNPNLIFVGQTLKIKTSNNSGTNLMPFYYKVKKGDTLWRIALQYNTTVDKLVKENQIKNRNLIFVGQSIKIY